MEKGVTPKMRMRQCVECHDSMSLLVFIHALSSGGAERVAANLANYWAAKGWQVTVVTQALATTDFYELHPAVKRVSLDLARNSANPVFGMLNNLRRVWGLRKALRQMRPDIALALMNTANILLSLASIGVKGVCTVGSEHIHPPEMPLTPAWSKLQKYLYGGLDGFAALTPETAVWLGQHTFARNIAVIPNAAPWPLSVQAPIVEPREYIAEHGHALLAVGRLSEQKGFDLLIKTFERLASEFPNWQLIILGEGAERVKLEGLVNASGLIGRVLLPGAVGNIGHWYEAADVYVMSSRFEGFGNTLVEAMAHGLPVVSFDCDTGPRHIISHGVDGMLVPAGDATAMEDTLRNLMDNKSLRVRLGSKAEEARERFSIENIAHQWEALFEEARLKKINGSKR